MNKAGKRSSVAIASCKTLPEPDPDQGLLEAALAERGVDARALPWDDPAAPFAEADLVVVRSTWNYIHERDAFMAWIDRWAGKLENHASVLRWNTHKRYLRELEAAGLPVVDTVLVPRGSGAELGPIMKKKRWFRGVIKPAVGAGSHLTRVVSGTGEDAEAFRALVDERDMLVQPYMAEVEHSGERAIISIDGEVTHAVRKSARFSGDAEKTEPVAVAEDERALADRALRWTMRNFPCGALLYGRVDLVRDAEGALRIMELELTEPSLFLSHAPAATARLADGIVRRLALLGFQKGDFP